MIKIDIDTRCWQIPKEEAFLGVESDDKVKILQFELSKNEFYDGLNFTDCNCFINYKNEDNDTIPYGITDMEVQEDGTVTFTWEVSRGATIFKGNTFAVLCAKKVSNDGTITNEWNSRIGSFIVAKGLEPSSSIVEVPEIDIISQLLSQVSELKGDLVDHVKESQKAIEDLNDKKITKFYANSLGEKTLNDSDNGKIQDMILYGKSLQNGTPTPDNPIEIQNVVNPKIEVCGKNLLNLQSSIYSNDVSCENNTIKNIATDSNNIFSASFRIGNYDGSHLYDDAITSNGKYIYNFTFKEKTSVHFKHNGYSKDVRILSILLEKGSYTFSFNVDGYDTSKAGGLIINDIQIELGSTATEYEPYKGQTATLPYTLNAIPVSSGGNVTIDGQQYIADYVDIENKKLVRMVGIADLGTLNPEHVTSWGSGKEAFRYMSLAGNLPTNYSSKSIVIAEAYKSVGNIGNWKKITEKGDNVMGTISAGNEYGFIIRNSSFTDSNSFRQAMSGSLIYYVLSTPTITDLTDEELQAFKDLMTYYSTTNVIVTSDQLDGFTTFNYPLSMANGWNLIKEQLGDTREYIYDMELQSAEAYVNSEYAVTLTELGV